ncbi:5-hydroxytryptamine receptor 2A [Eufriesea mexicana]|nr:5-hydroxytryptamine receptor 2A [Eufriesea mexicana]
MEEHLNQAGNSSTDGSGFTDPSTILTALVLGLLILVTVVGNLFVIAAILLERNLQSVANYLIVSLAVADLMVACLVMPLGAVYEKSAGNSVTVYPGRLRDIKRIRLANRADSWVDASKGRVFQSVDVFINGNQYSGQLWAAWPLSFDETYPFRADYRRSFPLRGFASSKQFTRD